MELLFLEKEMEEILLTYEIGLQHLKTAHYLLTAYQRSIMY